MVLVVDDAQHADDGLAGLPRPSAVVRPAFPLFVRRAGPPRAAGQAAWAGRPADDRRCTSSRWTTRRWPTWSTVWSPGCPTASRTALVERAEGIPLFAVETVRALIDRDLVVPLGWPVRRWPDAAALDLDALGAPASLQALVAARLDALDGGGAAGASPTPASWGSRSPGEGRSACARGRTSTDLDDVLDSLVRKEIVALQTDRFSAERGQYRFVQAVVRQVAYETLSRRDRKARHLAVADHLAGLPDAGDEFAVVIAQHLLDAVDGVPRRRSWWRRVDRQGLHILGEGSGPGATGRCHR